MAERSKPFGELIIRYDEDVLEPREWTLHQAHWAADRTVAAPPGPVLELCAGAGQIGLVVARATGRSLVQVDVDPRACELARANAAGAGLDSDVRCGPPDQVLAPEERFSVILADPPYIPSEDMDQHPDDPELAIDGGPDGLAVARQCLDAVGGHLLDDGFAILQLRDLGQLAGLTDRIAAAGLVAGEQRAYPGQGALVLLQRPSSTRSATP